MTNLAYRRSRELLEAEVGDELVGLDADAGKCFGFNGVATSVWKSLEQPKTFGQLRDALLGEYEVGLDQCSEELDGLLQTLMDKGLVEES